MFSSRSDAHKNDGERRVIEEDRPLPLQDWPELELEETLGSDIWDVESSLRLLDSEKHTRDSSCCCC